MDTRLRQARRTLSSDFSLLSLARYLTLKSRLAETLTVPRTLAAKLIQDLNWCELETDENHYPKEHIYVNADKECIVSALKFRGWKELLYSPHGRKHSIYMVWKKSSAPAALRKNIFIRKATPSESVRFFYKKMIYKSYLEMIEAAGNKNISVIYACLGSRYSDKLR